MDRHAPVTRRGAGAVVMLDAQEQLVMNGESF